MSNKQTLQATNTDLANILSIVQGLPVDISQQATAMAEHILEGYVGAYKGELVEGTAKKGVSGLAVGKITLSSDGTKSITIEHGLETAPHTVALVLVEKISNWYSDYGMYQVSSTSKYVYANFYSVDVSSSGGTPSGSGSTTKYLSSNVDDFTLTSQTSTGFANGDFVWIALAD